MITSRNEYGHYTQHKSTVYCSEHIDREPNITASNRLIDAGWLMDEKIANARFIKDLQDAMATDRLPI